MNALDLTKIATKIVMDAEKMRLEHAPSYDGKVGYCCIFSQSKTEYEELESVIRGIGDIAQDTPTGFTYLIPGIKTDAGVLRILKIRKPDASRTERGDADFSLDNYAAFKEYALTRTGFSLITRPKTEMIELIDPNFNVRAYFSSPPVETHDGIREALELMK